MCCDLPLGAALPRRRTTGASHSLEVFGESLLLSSCTRSAVWRLSNAFAQGASTLIAPTLHELKQTRARPSLPHNNQSLKTQTELWDTTCRSWEMTRGSDESFHGVSAERQNDSPWDRDWHGSGTPTSGCPHFRRHSNMWLKSERDATGT
eukprot:Selendium_serpulae@DN6481_c0_g2_i2.p1